MFSQKTGNRFVNGLLIALSASLLTGVLLMMFLPSYIKRMQPEGLSQQLSRVEPQNIAVKDQILDIIGGNNTVDISAVANKVMPSVVGISTYIVDHTSLFRSAEQHAWSVGSGVIVSEDGYILTNHHVIDSNAEQIIVTLENGDTVNATLQWSDPTLDLAIIKINVSGLTPAVIGDANKIRVGEPAVAIGNPLGLQFQRTVTAGIISAVNRTISVTTDSKENYMEGLIQTDASINPGNSGGPLININGEVIGINTVKVISAEGLGFAIPINISKPVVESFKKKGSYATPYMGLFAYDGTVAKYVGQNANVHQGIFVSEIDLSSPAYIAGIRKGDVITHIDDTEVNTMMHLRTEMFKCGPGKECIIRYIRDGKVGTIKLTLAERTNDGLVTR